jgi:hypothetical protein
MPAGEHPGEAKPVAGHARMADCVRASVQAVKATFIHLATYRPVRVSELKHLSVRDDSMLGAGKGRQTLVRSYLSPHRENKYDRNRSRPPEGG